MSKNSEKIDYYVAKIQKELDAGNKDNANQILEYEMPFSLFDEFTTPIWKKFKLNATILVSSLERLIELGIFKYNK